jgi:hypothetical protein
MVTKLLQPPLYVPEGGGLGDVVDQQCAHTPR